MFAHKTLPGIILAIIIIAPIEDHDQNYYRGLISVNIVIQPNLNPQAIPTGRLHMISLLIGSSFGYISAQIIWQ